MPANPSNQYSIPGYRIKLRTTKSFVVLVEGSTDRRLFERMLDYGLAGETGLPTPVRIDTAALLQSPTGRPLGNREKVEMACSGLDHTDFGHKVVGFVDREFREFDDGDTLTDQIRDHRVDGRVVWSRGHSLENYLFDHSILAEPFLTSSSTSYYRQALGLFVDIFDSVMRMACAASLAGKDTQDFQVIRSSFRWNLIDLCDKAATMNTGEWERALSQHLRLNQERVDKIVGEYRKWCGRTKSADLETVRWMCHGHIGLAALWAGYTRCIYEVNGNNGSETDSIFNTMNNDKLNHCMECWARAVLKDGIPAPTIVFEMLSGDAEKP